MKLAIETLASPIGPLTLASDGRSLVAIDFGLADLTRARLARRFGPEAAIREARDPEGFTSRLRAYFAGDLAALDGCPVDGGGTPFQRSVWEALREIGPGETASYSALAARIGKPRATRAVGLANGRNPVPIVVPCHRVIGADGSLTGYGGGLERKRWLLEHEANASPATLRASGSGLQPRLPGLV